MCLSAILGVGSLISGLGQAKAAKKAAKAQESAAASDIALQREMFDKTNENLDPYRIAGNNAMSAYLSDFGMGPRPMIGADPLDITTSESGGKTIYKVGGRAFTQENLANIYAKKNGVKGTEYAGYSASPMAKYLLKTGVDSIEGSRAAAGGLYSGATLQAMEDNRSDVIGRDTADYYSRLTGLIDVGQSSAAGQAAAGQTYASAAGVAGRYGATAAANGYAGAANAMSGTIGDMAGIYGYFQNQNPMSAYAGSANRGR